MTSTNVVAKITNPPLIKEAPSYVRKTPKPCRTANYKATKREGRRKAPSRLLILSRERGGGERKKGHLLPCSTHPRDPSFPTTNAYQGSERHAKMLDRTQEPKAIKVTPPI